MNIQVIKKFHLHGVNKWIAHLPDKVNPFLTDLCERHSWLERQKTHFGHTIVIFGNFLFNITVFLDQELWKMTIVSSLKLLKINRTPAFYIHQYGSQYPDHSAPEI